MTAGLNRDNSDPYPELVRRYFDNPAHAGDLPGLHGREVSAQCSESAEGASVRLAMLVDQGSIIAMRFRVFGCPYLIAAAEHACGHFEGGPATELRNFSVDGLRRLLQVPVEKTGRLLLLEDTLASLSAVLDN